MFKFSLLLLLHIITYYLLSFLSSFDDSPDIVVPPLDNILPCTILFSAIGDWFHISEGAEITWISLRHDGKLNSCVCVFTIDGELSWSSLININNGFHSFKFIGYITYFYSAATGMIIVFMRRDDKKFLKWKNDVVVCIC